MSAPVPRPPELPSLPVTFRSTLTRVILLTVGAAMFVVITVIAVTLEDLSAGERTSFVFVALLFLGVLALLSQAPHHRRRDGNHGRQHHPYPPTRVGADPPRQSAVR